MRAKDGTYLGGRTGDGWHDTYLRSLTWVVLDPLSLSDKEQAALLRGAGALAGRPSGS